MNRLKNKYVRLVLTLIVVAAVAYFFTDALAGSWDQIKDEDLSFNGLSAFSIVLFSLAVACSGLLWGRILNKVSDKQVGLRESVRVHILSWLLKYIPGQLGSVTSKVVWAKSRGYGRKTVLITFVYENIFLLLISFLASIPVLVWYGLSEELMSNTLYLVLFSIFVAASLAILIPGVLSRIMNLVFKKVIKQTVAKDSFLSPTQTIVTLLEYIGPRVITALAFVAVAYSLFSIDLSLIPLLMAVFTLAGAIGILAIFVPSGIGVREAVIVLFLAPFLPIEQAIIISLAARLYATFADVLLAAVYGLMTFTTKRSQT